MSYPQQVTRYHCPLCPWTADDPGPGIEALPGHEAIYPEALARQHAAVTEAVVRGHLETHPLVEWAREVGRLRNLVPAEAPDLTAVPWRRGRRKGRNLYAVTGEDWEAHPEIGCLDTAELAREAVEAHNAALARREGAP